MISKNGRDITSAQAIKLFKLEHVSPAIVRHNITFTVIIGSLLNYAQAFQEGYGVRFVDARIVKIVDEMMSFDFLATSSIVT